MISQPTSNIDLCRKSLDMEIAKDSGKHKILVLCAPPQGLASDHWQRMAAVLGFRPDCYRVFEPKTGYRPSRIDEILAWSSDWKLYFNAIDYEYTALYLEHQMLCWGFSTVERSVNITDTIEKNLGLEYFMGFTGIGGPHISEYRLAAGLPHSGMMWCHVTQ